MQLDLYNKKFDCRMMLGTAQYPSPKILKDSFIKSNVKIGTVSLRREIGSNKNGNSFWDIIKNIGIDILPNTAGCHSVKEAVTTAHMAKEIFNTDWIKLEVIGNVDTLQPDIFSLVEAARILINEGFQVFPYTTEDLIVAEKLLNVGCKVLMPWGSPIGSGLGLTNIYGLKTLRSYFPDTVLIIDAGIGSPSHAVQAMELGYDAVLLNTAVAKSGNPVEMAFAFKQAIDAGRIAYESDPILPQEMASPSTPVIGKAFL